MLFSTVKNREAFLCPVSCTSGCFQKTKQWKTKPKMETEHSQNEKDYSHFGTKKTEFKELQEFTEFKNGREEAISSSAYHWKGAA